MELSLLPGKPVRSPSGETLGYVKCAYVCKNLKDLSSLVCVDESEEEFVLPARGLVFSEEAVTAGTARLKAPSGIPCPVGMAVFNRAGRLLGHCAGFDAEKGVLTVAKGEAKLLFPLPRIAVGDVVFVSQNASSKEKKNTRIAQNAIQVAKTEEFSHEAEAFGVLGKQVKKSVEGVAETGETVTPATLKRARESNKLLELTANTITG